VTGEPDVTQPADGHRCYADLAEWWPLISPPEEYAEEAGFVATPADTWTLTEYAFLLRNADGTVRTVHETHRTGLFGRDGWLRLLADAGFEPAAVPEETTEDHTPREVFVGHRPADPS